MPGTPAPILIEMRRQPAQDLDVMIGQHLLTSGEERIDIKKFRYMLERGRDRAAVRRASTSWPNA
jgi:hypothetical protein